MTPLTSPPPPKKNRRVGRVISENFICMFYKKPLTSAPGFWLMTLGFGLLRFLQGSAALASAIKLPTQRQWQGPETGGGAMTNP